MAERIRVRATRNMPRLSIGREADVDPDDPYTARALASGRLVRVDEAPEASEAVEAAPTAESASQPVRGASERDTPAESQPEPPA